MNSFASVTGKFCSAMLPKKTANVST